MVSASRSRPRRRTAQSTLVHTDEGSKVSVTTDEGVFEGVYIGERLYLHVQPTDSGKLGLDPMTTGLLSGFSSINSLLEGEWVNVFRLGGLEGARCPQRAAGTTGSARPHGDRQAAAEQLSGSLQGIVDDLREPIAAAIAENSEITELAGANGERHLHISLDVWRSSRQISRPRSPRLSTTSPLRWMSLLQAPGRPTRPAARTSSACGTSSTRTGARRPIFPRSRRPTSTRMGS